MSAESTRAVLTAIATNLIITVMKAGAATLSQSASMMNEAIHSLMDTGNQCLLLLGLQQGRRKPDADHAFGHGQKKYLWNLWSAIGLFSIGCGLGLANAWHVYQQSVSGSAAVESTSLQWLGFNLPGIWVSMLVLLVAGVLEGFSLAVACRQVWQRLPKHNGMDFLQFMRKAPDPTLVAVVLEDSIAVFGLLLATLGIGLSHITGNVLWDIVFSALIALLLGVAAFFLGSVNMRYLTDVRDQEAERLFAEIVAGHPEVERYHDLRSIIVDDQHTVLVAEIEMCEEAMLGTLAQRIDKHRQLLLQRLSDNTADQEKTAHYIEMRSILEATLERTEQVVDELEAILRQRLPRISHLTLEVQGIADNPSVGTSTVLLHGDG